MCQTFEFGICRSKTTVVIIFADLQSANTPFQDLNHEEVADILF